MLILSRKVGERIRIGDAIELVVQRVCGERVTLGLEAPRDVKILRGELEKYAEAADFQPVGEERGGRCHSADAGIRSSRPR